MKHFINNKLFVNAIFKLVKNFEWSFYTKNWYHSDIHIHIHVIIIVLFIIIIIIITFITIIIIIIIIWRLSLLAQQLLLIAGCFIFSMPGLYLSLRQRNALILPTANYSFFFFLFFFGGGGLFCSFSHPPPLLFFSRLFYLFPTPLLFSNLYCLMDSTLLRMLAVSNKTDFCKVPSLYDIPDFFKLHSRSFGMNPSAPIIIGAVNVCLSHIQAISDRS